MLRELTLWGERDKMQIAIDRLRQFEPEEGYWLAFSGGKDSITIYRLAQMAGVKFTAHYCVTTVDPPELVRFIKSQYPDVEWHRPNMTMWQLIVAKGIPPLRNRRYCCEVLKESNGTGMICTGIRWAESFRRSRRKMVEVCFKNPLRRYVNPIIDWGDGDVWEFIRGENIPYCSLYDEGFTRLGCVLCPMSKNPAAQIARWPKIAANYVRTFEQIVQNRMERGLPLSHKSGEEMFAWWIQRHLKSRNKDQLTLFE